MSAFEKDLRILRAHLDKLAALVEAARLSGSGEDRACMERTIQLVRWALQAMVCAWLRNGDVARYREATEVEALCRRIVAKARESGLRIPDNDNLR